MTATVTAAAILRVVAAFEKQGRPVLGARLSPDGSVILLTETLAAPLVPSDSQSGDWADLAGET